MVELDVEQERVHFALCPPLLNECIFIVGSPVRFNVIDTSKATARGDGLGIVPCCQPTAFFVTAPGAQSKDFKISVVGKISFLSLQSVVSTLTLSFSALA